MIIEELYELYKNDVYAYLISLTHDTTLSEDLLSETFMAAMKSIMSFKGESTIKTWLFSIARYKWYEHLRKHTKKEVTIEELTNVYFENNLEENIINKNAVRIIMNELNKDSDKNKAVFLMRIQGFSYDEIAEKHGISPSSARVIDFRLKRKLREILIKEALYK